MGPHARRGGQQNPQGRFPPAHPRIFHGELQELSYALEMERAGRVEDNQKLAHLEAELEETKLQLKKQKALKETFINEAKEAKRELERLEKFSDPAVLNAAVIASKVHNDVKYMKKKNLQEDFEELKVAHLLSREAFVAEIQAERKKSLALQEELNQLQTSYEELRSQYEADDALLRQEAETQKYDEARLSEEQRLLENLRAEKDEMYQEMSQKIKFLQGSEKLLQEELIQLKCSYNELNCKYERDVSGLKQDMDRYQEEVRHATDANIEIDNENLQLINKLRAEKEELLQKMSGEIETYQQQVEQERKAHLEKTEEDKKLLDNMRAEKEELLHKMSREISIRQKREKQMLHELDQIHTLYEELKCRYERDIMDIQQQVEIYEQKVKQEEAALSKKGKKEKLIQERKHSALKQEVEKLQQQVEQERTAHLEKTEENKKLLDNMRAEKEELLQKMSGEIETYQHQVEQERKAHLEKTEEDKKLLDNMRAEKEELLHKMSGEISIRQKREKQMLHELDQIHTLYEELKCRYERDIMDIQQQVETYEQKIYKNDLQRARDNLLLADSLRAEEVGFQQQPITVSQEKEEESQNQVKVLNQEVSSEEDLSGEPLPGSSTDPESSEETEVAGETLLEDLDNPDDRSKVRNQTKCSPKIPYDENDHWKQWFCSPVHEVPPWSQTWGWGTLGEPLVAGL
ncbi:trichohyalin-like [Xiphophorus couchianus]|uniref:trichohyalin-like n=1 Tax=Xiphophorus couchianus TaxID=32473 RepID=UPI001016F080|nr:trichohyalin-like [Xiphophorus couchianus]